MRIAVYARVSTARQEQEETIESQIGAVRDRIKSDGFSFEEEDVFADEGYSGSLVSRPALDRLKDAVKADLYDAVYMYDYGRLSRDLSNLLILKDDIERNNTKVVSLHERITGEQATDRLLLQIMGAVYEYERKKTAQRFHNGKMQKAKRGSLVGYNAPYGYRYNKETGQFDVYEPEAVVVKQIFEWVAYEGLSTYAILQKLYEHDIKPPKQKSEYWTRGPVARILNNHTYYGKHYYNKSEAIIPRYHLSESKYRKQEKTGRRQRPKEEWIEISVEPIITKELFDKAREQIALNVKFKPTNRKYDYLLTGLIKCTCGANRNADGPQGKKYYRCISRHRYFDRKNRCAVGGLNVPVTDSVVWKSLSEFLSNPELIHQQAERWLEKQKAVSSTPDNTKALTGRLKQLKIEQNRYITAYGKGLLTESIFEEKIQETNRLIKQREDELASASKNRGNNGKITVDELVSKATFKLGDLDYKQRKFIVERVVDKIIASPKELIICGHIPLTAGVSAGKVNFEPLNRHSRPTQRRQIYPIQCPDGQQYFGG